MEKILIKTVLELVSAEIWREKKYTGKNRAGTDIPSFYEQMLLVQELLPRVMFDGKIISFGEGGCDLHEIPFFNYLMLISEPVITEHLDGTSTVKDREWRIIGFRSFEEVNKFVQNQEFLCGFCIYVRHRDYYKQVQYRMAFQRPGEQKTYTNEWGFYCPDADLNGIDSRNPNYKYFFEIVDLCELHCKDDIWCYVLGSLDKLTEYLLGRAIDCDIPWVRELGRITGYHFKETGEIHYEGKDYTYCIEVDDHKTVWDIYDEDGNPYCVRQHAFCSRERTCCEECQDCIKDTR